MSHKSDLELLRKLRAHPGAQNIVNCMEHDRELWLGCVASGDEDYPGEAQERVDAYNIAIELLSAPPLVAS